ncbi:MAG: heme biosynthesis protein HemY [Gammaproteobacteria bacterium]|nr:heme biosynthesis protein HemY [Gammaproteobacteria bacterium]
MSELPSRIGRLLSPALLSLVFALPVVADDHAITLSRTEYAESLQGFWLGQCIANWTGLVTEMDKVGGKGVSGIFYTRHDWGKPDQPSFFGHTRKDLTETIDWVVRGPDEIWGADDDTDIEYIYQHLVATGPNTKLTGEQIRDGWLTHIWTDAESPHKGTDGKGENFLWVSNQQAHDLMVAESAVPPATSDPAKNHFYDMIDAQLTTEIFGFYAPGRPDVALELAHLPIRVTARADAALAAEFYVILYALAPVVDRERPRREQILWMVERARAHLPDETYTAKMYDFVKTRYEAGIPWESVRDELYVRYQIEGADNYDVTARQIFCNGCFAAGINFAASIVSLLYGEGDFKETVKIAVLAGWDSDNPAATWGGLLGFMDGRSGLEDAFGQRFSDRFNIHRTRRGFPVPDGIDTFPAMAETGLAIVDRVVRKDLGGKIRGDTWVIPQRN